MTSRPTGRDEREPEAVTMTPAPPALPDWILVGLLSVLSGVIAVFGIFFLPLYSGSVPIPVVVVAVAVTLVVMPRAAYRLTHRMPAALAPVLVWAVVTIGMYLTTNSLYLNTAVAWQGWQFYLLVGVGALAAASSVGLIWSAHLAAELAAHRIRAGVRG